MPFREFVDFDALGKRTVPLLIIHSFKPDRIHHTSTRPGESGMRDVPWCVFCSKAKDHVNHA